MRRGSTLTTQRNMGTKQNTKQSCKIKSQTIANKMCAQTCADEIESFALTFFWWDWFFVPMPWHSFGEFVFAIPQSMVLCCNTHFHGAHPCLKMVHNVQGTAIGNAVNQKGSNVIRYHLLNFPAWSPWPIHQGCLEPCHDEPGGHGF